MSWNRWERHRALSSHFINGKALKDKVPRKQQSWCRGFSQASTPRPRASLFENSRWRFETLKMGQAVESLGRIEGDEECLWILHRNQLPWDAPRESHAWTVMAYRQTHAVRIWQCSLTWAFPGFRPSADLSVSKPQFSGNANTRAWANQGQSLEHLNTQYWNINSLVATPISALAVFQGKPTLGWQVEPKTYPQMQVELPSPGFLVWGTKGKENKWALHGGNLNSVES